MKLVMKRSTFVIPDSVFVWETLTLTMMRGRIEWFFFLSLAWSGFCDVFGEQGISMDQGALSAESRASGDRPSKSARSVRIYPLYTCFIHR